MLTYLVYTLNSNNCCDSSMFQTVPAFRFKDSEICLHLNLGEHQFFHRSLLFLLATLKTQLMPALWKIPLFMNGKAQISLKFPRFNQFHHSSKMYSREVYSSRLDPLVASPSQGLYHCVNLGWTELWPNSGGQQRQERASDWEQFRLALTLQSLSKFPGLSYNTSRTTSKVRVSLEQKQFTGLNQGINCTGYSMGSTSMPQSCD